jgi:hypothetical protein
VNWTPSRHVRPYLARPVEVEVDGRSRPRQVAGNPVASIREEWLVEEAWWSKASVRRHYFEVVLENGGNLTLFRSLSDGEWFAQRA